MRLQFEITTLNSSSKNLSGFMKKIYLSRVINTWINSINYSNKINKNFKDKISLLNISTSGYIERSKFYLKVKLSHIVYG